MDAGIRIQPQLGVGIHHGVDARDNDRLLREPLLPVHGLPEALRGARGPNAVQHAAVQYVAVPEARQLAGHVAPAPVGERIRRWFAEGTPSMRKTGGLPPQVEVNLPAGGSVTYPRSALVSMIQSLPRLQRAEARANLPAVLAGRIAHGQQVVQDVLAGNAGRVAMPATAQDISDAMLFFDAKARATGNAFSEGAFSIEDPAGRLTAFFNSCPEKYQRSSSHMKSDQLREIDGHRNTHRGIDLKQGQDGLPHGRATVLFSTIPGAENGESARRIFLKMESHGCRLSTLSSAQRRAGADGVADRPVKLRSDLWQAIGHGFSFITSRGHGSAAGSRKERLPDAVKNAFNTLKMHGGAYLNEQARVLLDAGAPLDSSHGVKTILSNIRAAVNAMPDGGNKNLFVKECARFAASMRAGLAQTDKLASRIGNEVMFDVAELNQADMRGVPGQQHPVTNVDVEKALFGGELTPAQEEALATIPASKRSTVLAALPQVMELFGNAQGLGLADQPMGELVDDATRIMPLYDNIAAAISGISDTIDDTIENTALIVGFALKGLSDADAANLHRELTSPAAERIRSMAGTMTRAFQFGTQDRPASDIIGHLTKSTYYAAILVEELEKRVGIPENGRKEAVPSPDAFIQATQQALIDDVPHVGGMECPAQSPGVCAQFIKDITRGVSFSVAGQIVASADEAMVAIPDLAMRTAVTRLANQAGLSAQMLMANAVTSGSAWSMMTVARAGHHGPAAPSSFSFNPETGVFTSRHVEQLGSVISGQQGPVALAEGSTLSYSYSCVLRQGPNGIEVHDMHTDMEFNWA